MCCDLRSKSIFDILITGWAICHRCCVRLWFALKKYLWHPDYRLTNEIKSYEDVVICAQKVSLTSWLQVSAALSLTFQRCDLRSKSIFDILITGRYWIVTTSPSLWFALKKYLWHPDYRVLTMLQSTVIVVICAQKVSLTSWLQDTVGSTQKTGGCDLRSKSIFDILITGTAR